MDDFKTKISKIIMENYNNAMKRSDELPDGAIEFMLENDLAKKQKRKLEAYFHGYLKTCIIKSAHPTVIAFRDFIKFVESLEIKTINDHYEEMAYSKNNTIYISTKYFWTLSNICDAIARYITIEDESFGEPEISFEEFTELILNSSVTNTDNLNKKEFKNNKRYKMFNMFYNWSTQIAILHEIAHILYEHHSEHEDIIDFIKKELGKNEHEAVNLLGWWTELDSDTFALMLLNIAIRGEVELFKDLEIFKTFQYAFPDKKPQKPELNTIIALLSMQNSDAPFSLSNHKGKLDFNTNVALSKTFHASLSVTIFINLIPNYVEEFHNGFSENGTPLHVPTSLRMMGTIYFLQGKNLLNNNIFFKIISDDILEVLNSNPELEKYNYLLPSYEKHSKEYEEFLKNLGEDRYITNYFEDRALKLHGFDPGYLIYFTPRGDFDNPEFMM